MTTQPQSQQFDSEPVAAEENLWATPTKSISWDVEPPMTIEGVVISTERAQQTGIKDKKPLTWADKRPRLKNIITLQTDMHDDEDDDGIRQLHVNIPGGLYAGIMDAIKASGRKTMRAGYHLAVTFTHSKEPEQKGMSGQKVFEALITPDDEPPF
jgi:hypothetical protein